MEVKPLANHTEQELLKAMAAIEAQMITLWHEAIVALYARARNYLVARTRRCNHVQGRGVTAAIDGQRYWLGSHRYLEELKQETPELHEQIEAMSVAWPHGCQPMGTDDHVCGFISLADAVRPESAAAIRDAARSRGSRIS